MKIGNTDVPTGLLILLVIAVICAIILNNTKAGRYILCLGSNKEAVRLSGVNVKKWEMLAYVICGTLAGIAAIAYVGSYTTVQPGLGDTFNNDAIASCVMGGTSMAGGVASIGGSIIGVLIVSLLQEGILAMGFQKDYQYVITGIIVLLAVYADVRVRREKELMCDYNKVERKDRDMGEVILTMKGIDKSFPVFMHWTMLTWRSEKGEVHALMGENGAGKSTLMKVLTGIYSKDSGSITYEGKEVEFTSPRDAQDAGIVIVHQELNMLNHLTVAQNIFIGREIMNGKLINDAKMNEEAAKLFKQLNIDIDPKEKMGNLTVGKQQMCEIAKAISHEAKGYHF